MSMKEPKHEPIPGIPGVVSSPSAVSDTAAIPGTVSTMKSNEGAFSPTPGSLVSKSGGK